MNHPDYPAHLRATRSMHSLRTTLTVALLATLAPVLVVLAVSVPGTSVAFLAGAATGTGVAVVRRHLRRRGTRTGRDSQTAVGTGN